MHFLAGICSQRAMRSMVGTSLRSFAHPTKLSFWRRLLPQMIGQRQSDAVAQRGLRQLAGDIEQDRAVAAVAELGIELAKGLDQIGLAMEVDRDLIGGRLHLIDPDRAAAAGLGREVARLAPFQRLFQRADALGRLGGLEDQPPQRQQLGFDGGGAGGRPSNSVSAEARLCPGAASSSHWCSISSSVRSWLFWQPCREN